MGKLIDLAGQRFGRLYVLERDFQYPIDNNIVGNKVYWKCKCDCGNMTSVLGAQLRSGKTQSCGCYAKEKIAQRNAANYNDIKGQRFGKLVALSPTEKRSGSNIIWLCHCDCGNNCEVSSNHLISKNTQSCGCFQKQQLAERVSRDLTNMVFGRLTVLYPTAERNDNHIVWQCQCSCGNECKASSKTLLNGDKQSCGCLNSIGEANIQKILTENSIQYEKEKTFEDFIYIDSLHHPRYDFYLPDFNRLIEFDGEQHFEDIDFFINEFSNYAIRQDRDKIKNQYALSHNIPLVRIPYWERKNITLEMIMGDKYLVKGRE